MNFNELYSLWMTATGADVRQSTSAARAAMWRGLGPTVGGRDIESFGRAEALAVQAELRARGLSEKTARDRLAMLRQMLRFAAGALGEDVRPLDWDLRRRRSRDEEPRRLQLYNSRETLRLVRGIKAETDAGNYAHLAVLLAVMTGMRIGEVCGLQWGDIDWRHSVATVRRNVTRIYEPDGAGARLLIGCPKTRNGFRDVPLLPAVKKALRGWSGKAPAGDHYVLTNGAAPAWPCTVRDKFRRLSRRLQLPAINFHGLRHTYATLLVEDQGENGNIKAIADILGHSDVSTTMNLYVHPSTETKVKIAQRAFRKFSRP